MPVSKAQMEATARYEAKAYDKVLLRLKRGKKAEIEASAKETGETINGYITIAIDARLSAGNNVLLDLSQADGFSLSQIEHAADQTGLSVNAWILDVIRNSL